MATSALLLKLLETRTQLSQYERAEMRISDRYNGIHKDLEKWTKISTDYDTNFDKVMYGDKDVTRNGRTYHVGNEYEARAYAELLARYTHSEILDNVDYLTELDADFDSQMTTMNAMIESLKAQESAYKEQTAASAQNTGLLGGN